MTLEVGKIYVPKNADELRDQVLTDLRLEALKFDPNTEPPVQPGTDWWLLATAIGNAGLIVYANNRIHEDNADLFTASGQLLDDKRVAVGLPEVVASPSSGRVIAQTSGVTTIPAGLRFLFPNGFQGQALQTYLGVTDGQEIEVVAVDTGSSTNLAAGQTVRWISPPLNLKSDAKVAPGGLAGGSDKETDARKLLRILNRLRNLPAGGNWAHMREIALNSLASLQECYVYPALGGPGSVKIVPTRDYDLVNNVFTRVPSSAQLQIVTDALHAQLPSPMEVIVQAPTNADLDWSIKLTLSSSTAAGGDGTGWLDATVWPLLVGGDGGRVRVSAVTSTNQITVTAGTSAAPIAGQTHVMWFASTDRKFRTYLVTAVAGSAGAWQLTLDTPLVDSTGTRVAVHDYVSPASANGAAYAEYWRDSVARVLGPQENTSAALRLPRALRHPLVADGNPIQPSGAMLAGLMGKHPEVRDAAFGYTSTLITPSLVADSPLIFALKHFGVYSQ